MSTPIDGPASPLFQPLPVRGNASLDGLEDLGLSNEMTAAYEAAPQGDCVSWGIPFRVRRVLVPGRKNLTRCFPATKARWLVFMHTTDTIPLEFNRDGFISPMRGTGRLAEGVASYVVLFDDGTELPTPVRRRHQIGMVQRQWGENCVEAVAHRKPHPTRQPHEQPGGNWGNKQTRVNCADSGAWVNWLWAWENPHPEKSIIGIRVEPISSGLVLSAVTAGMCREHPLRWQARSKAVLRLRRDEKFQSDLSAQGLLAQIQLDLGQIISASPRCLYPEGPTWESSDPNSIPEICQREILVEYTAHPEALFHLGSNETVSVSRLARQGKSKRLRMVPPSRQRVRMTILEARSREPVAAKLHVHGSEGEYLAPVDRHRIPNAAWFEDYSVDFPHQGQHFSTYVNETVIDLPLGTVYVEVTKGFEIRPVRTALRIDSRTTTVEIEVEKALDWREKGWVSADTHVHFLSPSSALLEGAGEGVNVVNLLASQWGELMTNVGDFDGATTHGAKETGGDGEYLVRVGTENRQHVLGHISLLGYNGPIIAPMTTGGSDEAALGDPVDILLTEWARQCREQGGIVVLPHFPNPRMEGAAAIVSDVVDGVEMTSWGDLYSGINPYSLSDWYRYLNCGYFVAAVGGTDKMSASTAVGTVRTYARLPDEREFSYDEWMQAVRAGNTFVTYGPLLEFSVDGHAPGSRISMTHTGGKVDVTWEAASVTTPMTRVELIVNGEIRESVAVDPDRASGSWSIALERSSWLALLVRGQRQEHPEIIAAHSSPVMVSVAQTPFMSAADALTILEQIEGALAYIDTVGTRAETAGRKRMKMVLTSAHRNLHNRMHQIGHDHNHNIKTDHH